MLAPPVLAPRRLAVVVAHVPHLLHEGDGVPLVDLLLQVQLGDGHENAQRVRLPVLLAPAHAHERRHRAQVLLLLGDGEPEVLRLEDLLHVLEVERARHVLAVALGAVALPHGRHAAGRRAVVRHLERSRHGPRPGLARAVLALLGLRHGAVGLRKVFFRVGRRGEGSLVRRPSRLPVPPPHENIRATVVSQKRPRGGAALAWRRRRPGTEAKGGEAGGWSYCRCFVRRAMFIAW